MKAILRSTLLAAVFAFAATASRAAMTGEHSSPEVSIGNGQLKLSAQATLGVAQGEAREIVYDVDELGNRYKLSELFWDIDNVMMAGGTLALQIGPRYRVQATFMGSITEGDGRMDDYDWLAGSETPWTDWSLSDVTVQDSYSVDLRAAAEVYHNGALGISGVLGYRHDHWSWEDQLIGYIYSSYGFRDDIGIGDGSSAITYEQTFDIPYFGVEASLAKSGASANFFLYYSPFVMAKDDDYHLLRDTRFQVEADGGDYYGVGLRVNYDFASHFSISAAAEWQVIEEIIGDTTIDSPEESGTSENNAGIANQWLLLSCSLGYRF